MNYLFQHFLHTFRQVRPKAVLVGSYAGVSKRQPCHNAPAILDCPFRAQIFKAVLKAPLKFPKWLGVHEKARSGVRAWDRAIQSESSPEGSQRGFSIDSHFRILALLRLLDSKLRILLFCSFCEASRHLRARSFVVLIAGQLIVFAGAWEEASMRSFRLVSCLGYLLIQKSWAGQAPG